MHTHTPYFPYVPEESFGGTQYVDARDHLLAARKVELTGPINAESTAATIRSLLYLQECDPSEPVTLYINSPGGEVQSGLALYDVMQSVTFPIRCVCLGMAASMAAIIFVSGDTRDMLPHSLVMIHDPLIDGGVGGSALSVKAQADTLMRTRQVVAEIIAKHTGMELEHVFELTAKDTYFEADEAVREGLADSVTHTL